MGIFILKNKTGESSISPTHHSGVPGINPNWPCELIVSDDSDYLEIRPKMSKKESVLLPLEKITGIAAVTEKEVSEKSKSVLGRAVLGGVLLGPVGAIVGSTSGLGTKKKVEYHSYIVINYKPNLDEEETNVLVFNNNGLLNVKKFIDLVKEMAGIIDLESKDSKGSIIL